ncbi:MAG: glycogen synthase [Candidatus Zambryskibacteria bacterium]|nr:glycogen synthase [Candidatus Zambryskibacteria bacterium]
MKSVMGIFQTKKSLKILFVATEAAPFVKVGGLGSVIYSLPRALRELGHDARVIIPKYLSVDENIYKLKLDFKGLEVPTGNENEPAHLVCNVKRYDPKKKDTDPVTTYFLENQEYYEQRANVYGYADDAVRWALLCRGALEFVRLHSNWTPDVVVSSDWQTGLVANFLKTVYKNDPVLSKIASVLTIHNLYFQAMFDHKFVSEMDFDDGHSSIPGFNSPRLEHLNGMRRGIIYSDVINTVSPTYAKEIMTEEYGELLDDLLRERRAVLSGILNGIDYDLWNPEIDANIESTYDSKHLDLRCKNRTALQERFRLPIDKNAFIVSIVGRLTKQKGLDLLLHVMETLLNELPIQLIVVGEGEFMGFFHDLESKYPEKVATHLKFDNVLPHLVFAGVDAVLVPSQFEPCGLVQMEAMRMGAIPIVRKTGGLADSVEDYNPNKETGTGFTFERFDSSSLMISFVRAFENFRDKKDWRALQKRAMAADFSWISSAKKYIALFQRAVEIHNRY